MDEDKKQRLRHQVVAKSLEYSPNIIIQKWIDFANARIEGIASPACSSPLIIIALICDVICSYIGLLALLLMMISITHRLCF